VGQFRGTVIDTLTGSPLPNATVTAHAFNGDVIASMTTDTSGQYVTPPLAPGVYYGKAAATGFITEVYREIACVTGCDVRSGRQISVAANVTVGGIDFTLTPAAAVVGTVVDAQNSPIAGVDVSLFNAGGVLVKTASTGVNGAYTATGFPSGTYFARTSNSA